MIVPETYIATLRFKVYSDAPKNVKDKWKELKDICEYNPNNENKMIVKEWLSYCKNEETKNLPYLNRCEGGLGHDNNFKNKQLRFRSFVYMNKDNDIVFDQIYNTTDEKWSFEEFDDLIYGFIKFSENYIKGKKYVDGIIELINKELYYRIL